MNKHVVAPCLAALLLVTACAPSSQDPASSTDGADASPSRTSAPVSASPSRTPEPTATERPTLGKPASYEEGFSYATGALPARWLSQAGWYAQKGAGAEVIGDLTAFVEQDMQTRDQTLVVTDSAGDILYRSPSLGLDPEQRVEPSLDRVRQNGQEFFTFYQIGVPLQPGAGQGAAPVAQLIVVDAAGKATAVEEDMTGYRPTSTHDGNGALAFTATDGGLGMQSGVAAGPDSAGFVRVLNAEIGLLEPIPELEGQSWLARIDGVDVYRSPRAANPQQGLPEATLSIGEWSMTFADHPSGSIVLGSTFVSVRKVDETCESVDVHTGQPVVFEGAAQGCAFPAARLPGYATAASPNGELYLMHWQNEQGVDAQWVVNLRTGEQKRIDPASDFYPAMVSDAGEVYGTNSAGDRTGYLKFPEQMAPQFDEVKRDLPTAITSEGLAMFKYEDLPTYFALPVD
ncbi:hypothetical protein [Arthrobacter sp. zg-Y844]|uniref:hypothetical protein n=1 Tax=Arthrobacter sp. zg-Y844 TaxID=2964612 RepID=UPI002102A990|nr:hypothetical protein [Arthrobacter sp. zg-Y844]MCQ1987093.1 hypothetical protein [Arthrobacter sp. zg-Y844]